MARDELRKQARACEEANKKVPPPAVPDFGYAAQAVLDLIDEVTTAHRRALVKATEAALRVVNDPALAKKIEDAIRALSDDDESDIK